MYMFSKASYFGIAVKIVMPSSPFTKQSEV